MSLTTYAVTFDSSDALELAQFWAQLLERAVDPDADAGLASIGLAAEAAMQPGLMFVKVPEGKAVKNRVHLDLMTPSLDQEVDRLLQLGAKKADEHRDGDARWVTLMDPQGNEFDVIAQS
jgi:hypothetical protein